MRILPALLSSLLLVVACNAKIATVLESDGGGAAPSGSGTGTGGSSTVGATCQTDAQCNADPSISTLYGRCDNGRCNCDTPASKERPTQAVFTPSGKCGPVAPVCTVGQDQTCNANPEMSSLAGKCLADGTCQCNGDIKKNFAGKCGSFTTAPGATTFPEYLEGLWLIGWSGGLDHFSWVRLQVDPSEARFRSQPSNRKGVTPFFNCDAAGSWQLTAKPQTIFLYFPESCKTGTTAVAAAYTFGTVTPSPSFPKGALLQVAFEHEPNEQALLGFKFPDDTCDPTLTTCADPFEE